MAGGAIPAAPGVEVVEPLGGDLAGRVWPSSRAAYWALLVIVLATFLTFFDQVVFGMLAQRIKHDFGLTDSQLGFLAGPASIICYFFVGIPLARLADIVPRKYVLAGGVTIIGTVIALGGIAQTFVQFVGSRVFLAAGGSAHAPSSYSLLADAFPPKKLTRAFALLQFGFIGGTTLGPWIGGMLVMMTATWAPSHVMGLRVLGWQWIMIWMLLPALLVALLFLTVKEPARLAPAADALQPPAAGSLGRRMATFMGWDAFKAINAKPKVYYPLFGALALSALDVFGLQFWRTPFMIRTYGWNEAQIGKALGLVVLVGSLAGLAIGGVFVEWLAKRHKDANVRASAIWFGVVTVTSILSPLMPTPEASIGMMGIGVMAGMAGAVPQNAAVQRVAPNAMRGQVTAMYLFMFTFFGALGSWFVGLIQDNVVGDEAQLWKSLVITAGTLLPLATLLMIRAMKPYREEVTRLEAEGR
ncbi:MAG: MFS transporter [Sphingomonadales bacterium]|nr:MFS transporter [Sphingomonadales bacterium]